MNDKNTLSTYGSKTDAYRVFQSMLDDGNPPDAWENLYRAATDESVIARLAKLSKTSE